MREKSKDIKGQRFGSLVALEQRDSTKHGYKWNCICDCGNKKDIVITRLLDKSTVSCGCKRAKSVDQGTRFHRLVITGNTDRQYTPSGKYTKRFECKCDCGNIAYFSASQLLKGKIKSCGCFRAMTGEGRRNWKGGRTHKGGYVFCLCKDHPRACRSGYVAEHILVVEKTIGRLLVGDENVHHINGDKTDNKPENLELWSTKQPKGQRIPDKVNFAIEILTQYASTDDIKRLTEALRLRGA